MLIRGGGEAEQMLRACGFREPSRDRITQDRFSRARPLTTTVNDDEAAKPASARACDAIGEEAADGVST